MIDAGEQLSVTLKREFSEEALNCLDVKNQQRELIREKVEQIFEHGQPVSIAFHIWRRYVIRHSILLCIFKKM